MKTERNGNFTWCSSDVSKIGDTRNKKNLLVAVLIPSLDGMIHYSVLHVWTRVSMICNYVLNIVGEDTYLDLARNKLVEVARQSGKSQFGKVPDYYFWIDQDSVLPPDCFEKLLARNLDIVSGFYVKKRDNHDPVSRMIGNWKRGELVKASVIGFGCALIKGTVFEKIPMPWFKIGFEDLKEEIRFFGEDIWFCNRAIEYGYSIWVDTSVEVGHHGAVVYPEDYYKRR